MTAAVQPNYDESVDFLRRWPNALWVLTAIEPTKKRGITTATFQGSSEESEAREWLEKYGAKRNVYFHVNPTLTPLSKKAKIQDMAAMVCLHVDVDPRAGEDVAQEQARILSVFKDNLPPGQLPPSCVIFSGGGYQGFWLLKEGIRLDGDVDRCEAAKLYNLEVERAFEGDSCHNVDRIMRLPGTVNRPNEVKRKKGRKPALAKVMWWTDAVYDLKDFTPAVRVQPKTAGAKGFASQGVTGHRAQVSGNVARLGSLDELPKAVNDETKQIIQVGHDPKQPNKQGSRSEWLWAAVCELVRCKVADDVIYSVITDPRFGISASVLGHETPDGYARRQIERGHEFAINPKLRDMNDEYALIKNVGGRCRIVSEVEGADGRTSLLFQGRSDFLLWANNDRVTYLNAAGNPVSQKLGDWWLLNKNRRQYRGIVFDPSVDGNVGGLYNQWKGFAYPAIAGSCELFLDHLRDNVCDGNADHYAYLMGWMATAVQKPAQQGHTAVVMRGTQGTGKSFFAKTFGRLFGQHFLQVSDPKHLIGSFNAHLRDCLVLFGDEAFYAGDKKHESVLKMLVTEDTMTIEAKGVDAHTARNFIKLIMASNESWVVPAGHHERRYFVLDVNPARQQDNAYFGAIQAELDDGGMEALLHTLRTWDLSEFRIRDLPQTKGLQEQKVLSFDGLQSWWFEKLQHGDILHNQPGWPKEIASVVLNEDYYGFARTANVRATVTPQAIGAFLKKCMPAGWASPIQARTRILYTTASGETRESARPYVRKLPGLTVCRQRWDEVFGQQEWEEVDSTPLHHEADQEHF